MISKKDVYMLNAKTSVRVPMIKLSKLRELRQQLRKQSCDFFSDDKTMSDGCPITNDDKLKCDNCRRTDNILGVEGEKH